MNVLDQASGKNWTLYLGDSVEVCKGIPDSSIDFVIHSPPFSSLYIYSDSIADMGNSANHAEFFQHYGYLIRELYRVTVPGRLCAVHCKDLPLYMNRDGAAGLYDFPGDCLRAFESVGWIFHSRVTIWKDPVIEMQRTKNHGLLYKNFKVRGEVSRQGMADYILVFRKWEGVEGSESTKPIQHPPDQYPLEYWQNAASPAQGDELRSSDVRSQLLGEVKELREILATTEQALVDLDNGKPHTHYAVPVWHDIDQTNVLNYRIAKDNEDEKHIAPLQLDVIERCIRLWTNPGDVVLSPFSGVGSEGYIALQLGRKFIGIELKMSYWKWAQRYLTEVVIESSQVTMFDMEKVG